MITAHDMHWHPDAVRHDGADPDYHAANQHRMMDGKIYAPADNLKLGYEGTSIDRPHGTGLLFMSFGDVGLSKALPPPSMRELAAALTKLADMAEANAARDAGAAIYRAAGK